MSLFEENLPSSAEQRQCQFDRLVDGELSEADRRALLLQLEHEPEGWRRCALAFLEAQCWKAELGQPAPNRENTGPCQGEVERRASAAAAGQQDAQCAPQPAVVPASRSDRSARWQRWRQYAATVLTISASLLIALAVGMGLHGTWFGSGTHGPDNSFVQKVVQPLSNDKTAENNAAAGDWETVSLSAADSAGGPTQTYVVPAQRRDALDQNLLAQMPDALPPEVQQAFEESGHRIVQHRDIESVPLKDGRRLVVPVDHVEIQYVGRQSQ